MSRSYVVTGGGRGVGRAVAERLVGAEDSVVVIELDAEAVAWSFAAIAFDRGRWASPSAAARSGSWTAS